MWVREEGRKVEADVIGPCEPGGSWLFNFKLIIEVGGKMYEWIEGKGCGLEGVMNERVEERKCSS